MAYNNKSGILLCNDVGKGKIINIRMHVEFCYVMMLVKEIIVKRILYNHSLQEKYLSSIYILSAFRETKFPHI